MVLVWSNRLLNSSVADLVARPIRVSTVSVLTAEHEHTNCKLDKCSVLESWPAPGVRAQAASAISESALCKKQAWSVMWSEIDSDLLKLSVKLPLSVWKWQTSMRRDVPFEGSANSAGSDSSDQVD